MRTRNILIYVLVVMVVFAFTACAKKQTASQSASVETTPVPPPPATPVETDTESPAGGTEVDEVAIPVLSDIFFDFDKAHLTSDAKRVLEENARQLKDARSVSLTIEGHCDERGTNAYNLALGERRAKAAKDYLRSLGISAGRLKTVSMGEERPFDTGHNEAAWAKNRRAHMVIN